MKFPRSIQSLTHNLTLIASFHSIHSLIHNLILSALREGFSLQLLSSELHLLLKRFPCGFRDFLCVPARVHATFSAMPCHYLIHSCLDSETAVARPNILPSTNTLRPLLRGDVKDVRRTKTTKRDTQPAIFVSGFKSEGKRRRLLVFDLLYSVLVDVVIVAVIVLETICQWLLWL